MEGYAAPGTESYGSGEGNGWYGEGAEAAPAEQQGFSIPTTGQTNGGGPMRRGGSGGSRYNPMSRGKTGGGDGPVSAAGAEKNDLGFIIFAYNIGYQTDESQLEGLFAPYGSVAKVNVIQDFATGQGKGFGFVTMPNAQEAESAVASLNGSDFNGNTLQIRFKSPKGQGGGSRGGRGGSFRGAMSRGGFRGGRGAPRGGGFRGGRGAPRGGARGRGRGGAYSSAPSAYDSSGYGGYGGYDSYGGGAGYADPSGGYGGYDYSDPYSGYSAAGTGYASYGAASGGW